MLHRKYLSFYFNTIRSCFWELRKNCSQWKSSSNSKHQILNKGVQCIQISCCFFEMYLLVNATLKSCSFLISSFSLDFVLIAAREDCTTNSEFFFFFLCWSPFSPPNIPINFFQAFTTSHSFSTCSIIVSRRCLVFLHQFFKPIRKFVIFL